ncbi:hypothetical protein NEOLEDRAFT_557194 [Neolentinus lepideus HHB14362 ss-1]|uniref:Uncharacterized protein n=1 Tax=Neolentinus lepideus HHB14362 ss-1 TaxID=1314782 RepID=A0A165R5H0_9AGAM|nr:hypothetical protein NEOLEDRAFT_557194 [Neolentinus lepideus HHB14362 ss-1]
MHDAQHLTGKSVWTLAFTIPAAVFLVFTGTGKESRRLREQMRWTPNLEKASFLIYARQKLVDVQRTQNEVFRRAWLREQVNNSPRPSERRNCGSMYKPQQSSESTYGYRLLLAMQSCLYLDAYAKINAVS